jgi:4-diphosphocytidyl-2C-methyl-D-erythritol kinase
VREVLEVQGALYSQMTGTGSACFGLFPSEESALKACKAARANGWTAYTTEANR